jgi:hypothetical protein
MRIKPVIFLPVIIAAIVAVKSFSDGNDYKYLNNTMMKWNTKIYFIS